jgi:hypothetical protein
VRDLLPGFQLGLPGEERGFGRGREAPPMTAIVLTVWKSATAWTDWRVMDLGEKIEIRFDRGRISVECECTFEHFIEMVKESGKVLDMRFCQTERIWGNGDR